MPIREVSTWLRPAMSRRLASTSASVRAGGRSSGAALADAGRHGLVDERVERREPEDVEQLGLVGRARRADVAADEVVVAGQLVERGALGHGGSSGGVVARLVPPLFLDLRDFAGPGPAYPVGEEGRARLLSSVASP